jgi:hypothetical protein
LSQKTASTKTAAENVRQPALTSAWNKAWNALQPIRATWAEKEQALMAQSNDSVSGNITATRVTDAALSTLSYERQARVMAQMPTGRFYSISRAASKATALLNVTLNNYIIPNADSQFPFLTKARLWGLYASVYGSMPAMYDYRVDDAYVGPDWWLIDPRCFAPVDGLHNVQEAGCYVSTIMTVTALEGILKRKTTSYNKTAVKKLIDFIKNEQHRPSKDNDSNKTNTTVGQRYDLSNADDRCEIVTKYTHGKWVSFAPDFANMETGEDLVIRDMDNPHQSGRVPVVMRHCFPVLNSIMGLGDFERGMKIQKAKDSIINLFLEGAKNRIYPPLKMIDNQLTPSTIRYQAGTKWKVKNMNAVEPVQFGQAPLAEFQQTYAALQGMLQNQFGTSTTEVSEHDGGPSMGKTPQALKMQANRENARDTWDRFMGEQAMQELLEGMSNLLTVKMEKPINFSVFEQDLQALGYQAETTDDNGEKTPAKEVPGLTVFDSGKVGKMTVDKSMLQPGKKAVGYQYLIDSNSTMKQDEEEQFAALMATWNLVHQTPGLIQGLAAKGLEYDEGDHLKKIFIAAGINDWDKVLKENAALMQQVKQAQMQPQQPPGMDPNALAQAAAGGQIPQGPPPGMAPGPMMPPQGAPMPQGPPMAPSPQGMPQFEDPQVAALAQQMLTGAAR